MIRHPPPFLGCCSRRPPQPPARAWHRVFQAVSTQVHLVRLAPPEPWVVRAGASASETDLMDRTDDAITAAFRGMSIPEAALRAVYAAVSDVLQCVQDQLAGADGALHSSLTAHCQVSMTPLSLSPSSPPPPPPHAGLLHDMGARGGFG